MTIPLIPYEHQIAGHQGVLSDASGVVICKPCTASEFAFYASANNCPSFKKWVPTYIGNLTLDTSFSCHNLSLESNDSPKNSDVIVLENLLYPFVRPSTIDVKLGSRLWDDDASPTKRERLEYVSKHTTSGSLGFRISAMQLWSVHDKTYKKYSKDWGKSLTETTVRDGLNLFFSSIELVEQRCSVISEWIDSLSQIQDVMQTIEIRLYSSSLLFVYESDPDALARRIGKGAENKGDIGNDNCCCSSSDDSTDEHASSAASVCRFIDFAHAHWVAGQGPDENVLYGISSLKTMLMEIKNQYHS